MRERSGRRWLHRALLGLVSVAAIAACSSDKSPSSVKSLRIAPTSFTLAAGLGGEVVATATLSDGSTRDVTRETTWSSDDAAIATVSQDASGAPQVRALAQGQTTVRARWDAVSAEAPVQVTDATLVSMVIAPAAPSLAVGLSQQLTATATLTDGGTHVVTSDVQWNSSDATVATVSESGLVRAIAPGQATVRAVLGTVEVSALVTVTDAVVTAIAVTPDAASLARGSTVSLVATATRSDGTVADVSTEATWSSSDTAVVSLSQRLASGQGMGTARITATFREVSGSTQLTVAEATALTLSPAEVTLVEGHPRQLHATATLDNGTSQDVTTSATWKSSQPTVAVVSMDASTRGQVTPVGPGASSLTATFNGLSASAQVNVARLSVSAVVPTFQTLEDGVVSFTAQLAKAVAPSTKLRWRVTLSRTNPPMTSSEPEIQSPVVGQALRYDTGTAGEVSDRPETWMGGFETDGSGVTYLGPEEGFEVGTTQLQTSEGQTWAFRTRFAIKGRYTQLLELLDVSEAGAPVRLGGETALSATVGTLRAPDASELLLYAASPTGEATSEESSFPQAYAVSPDGTRLRQLTPVPAPFVSPRDVHSELTRSPDRKTMAWVDGRDMFGGIFFRGVVYLADADGSHVRRLSQVSPALCGERSVEFSPDGQWISFVRSCSYDPFPGRASTEFQYIIRPDGTDERRILIADVNDMPSPTPISSVVYGTFSRDSATLYTVEYLAKGTRLWAYSLADGSARKVLDFAVRGQEMASLSKFPMVLPNGDLLYHYRNLDVTSDTWLERVKPDGTGREIVRPIGLGNHGQYLQSLFTLSPDGTRVAYAQVDPETGIATIMVSNIDGTDAVSMGNPPAYFVRRVSWVR
ncbi:Ig-like domain-containing protein [Myxococcus llanfairpwllgwyngyllgogerychwyrndrobwllllantysiliogogogochensis]|nr:Ig-like domain-containing protein [Myxococcus llanfairpwllgwyngyllgogerychwyrndrobwllllantysiliogogogochensis]